MNGLFNKIRFIAAGLCLTLAACGGGGDDGGGGGGAGGAPPVAATIGAAGGTVSSPSGAQVVVPAGALAQNTAIAVTQSSAGAPALPAGVTGFGQMFAFTPHGTAFTLPVTITVPFDPVLVPAGATPTLYKTNAARSAFEPVAGAMVSGAVMTAQVTGFSNAIIGNGPLFRGDPVREWAFSDFRGRTMNVVEIFSRRKTDGGLIEDIRDFGPVFPSSELLDHDIRSIGGNVIPADGRANGQIFSSADGVTYGVFAEAPYGNPNLPDSPAGSRVLLRQFQAFIKRSPSATLEFTLTGAFIDLRDDNSGFDPNSGNPKCVYPPGQVDSQDACQDLVRGQLIYTVQAYTHATAPGTPGTTFFHRAATAEAKGHRGHFDSRFTPPVSAREPLWTLGDFQIDPLLPGVTGLVVSLKQPRTYSVDLSQVAVGQEFTLNSAVLAEATNRQGNKSTGLREFPSAASAFLRDPIGIGGTTLAFSGLDPIANPVTVAPPEVPVQPAACVPGPAPDPQAGVIQFSAANYSIEELGGASQPVLVTRTGGSRGAVTATFTTSNGTAIAGTDYSAVATSVFFADGDAEQRLAEVPIIRNTLVGEPSRTVNLTLSQPGGCAAIGAQSTAVLTIDDAELPAPPPSFTIGGRVSGLIGSGLVLQDLTSLPITPGNGPFTFALPTRSGSPYAVTVVTQPANPGQICTVTNGSGTVANANITNVAVDCVTPPAVSGLDASFGSAGKVTTPATGSGNAVAVQSDGKVVTAGSAFTLTRHNADGSPDTGFGTGGKVTTSFGAGSGTANDVAIQSDGKIVVAGSTRARAGFGADDNFSLRRYDSTGNLDASFGAGGIVVTDFAALADVAKAVAIQADGRIVVAGQSQSASGTDFAVARYNADGSLDTSFGSGGKLTTDLAGGPEGLPSIALQPDGKIIVAGRFGLGNSIGGTALLRYSSAGILDQSFGDRGKVIVASGVTADAMALQPDGKILVAGSVNAGSSNSAFGLTRFLATGSPDTAFGTVTTSFFSAGSGSIGRNVVVQANGSIVVVGEAASGAGSSFDMAIARYDANGSLDAGFGTGGKLLVDFFVNTDAALDVVIQPDGKIVVAGLARNGSASEFALVRINP